MANLVVRIGDRWLTPPVECGLLPGTFRAELLARGELEEARLRPEELESADEIWLINSLRGWIPVELVDARRREPVALPGAALSGSQSSG